ncbi:hypothetical protein NLG97_g7314 [Lecanicillium saksenae]|uniref:Uncharacterized protein n=1 Tax=Lecanicillium saksenae TaxID=468837 RepID=A0ACC1QPQ1_9HYPO|nr:hypothetical protein NLG97_g7314 [Lecanicillium saksenae]
MLAASASLTGSAKWWVRLHRAHHRYTDTENDPYSMKKGFFHAHMGWTIFKQAPIKLVHIDVSDLNNDAVASWQHRNYFSISLSSAYILPTICCGLFFDDWMGGFIYGGLVRVFFVQQSIFCVNSLAHWLGDQPYSDRHTPRDHILTAILTLGEGFHNFHHEFPSDYRNTYFRYQYDPTKWAIYAWSMLGIASDLKRFRSAEIEKARLRQCKKQLQQKISKFDYGQPLEELPIVSWAAFRSSVKEGLSWTVISGVVYDVAGFIDEHPGGPSFIRHAIGKDATAMLNGGIYGHSDTAFSLLETLRIGILSETGDH